jgi:thiol-disulfide isomerase/thioredoxin
MKRLLTFLAGTSLACSLMAAPIHTKGPEPVRIAHGEPVNLTDYLVPGKTTVFDFTSEYCPPCRGYDQPLVKLHQQRSDVAVVKVDINRPDVKKIDWQSPVAQQFVMRSIPHFKVYGPDGQLVAEDKLVIGPDGKVASRASPARIMVDQWLAALK